MAVLSLLHIKTNGEDKERAVQTGDERDGIYAGHHIQFSDEF